MDGESRAQLPPPFLGEDAGMAHVFAAAIHSAGAKRDAQFELLAVTLDVLDAQGIILVGTSFGASVRRSKSIHAAQMRAWRVACSSMAMACLAARSFRV